MPLRSDPAPPLVLQLLPEIAPLPSEFQSEQEIQGEMEMSEIPPREHFYQAEAVAIQGHLELPLKREIEAGALVTLPEEGGYVARQLGPFRVESAISFQSAHTQVAGNPDLKSGHGWSTLTTSVIEGLNVLDVLTADRVVGQVGTEHPHVGYVPRVTFLGTRFDNLRIAGHPVKLDIDLDLFGTRAPDDSPYTRSRDFLTNVSAQHQRLQANEEFPAERAGSYNQLPARTIQDGVAVETAECSLVNQADGHYPGRTFGHVIHVPNFGLIRLGVVRLLQSDFQEGTGIPKKTRIELTMIDLRLGCIGHGGVQVGQLTTNGHSKP